MMEIKELCSVDNGKCEGICRETHGGEYVKCYEHYTIVQKEKKKKRKKFYNKKVKD